MFDSTNGKGNYLVGIKITAIKKNVTKTQWFATDKFELILVGNLKVRFIGVRQLPSQRSVQISLPHPIHKWKKLQILL